MTDLIVLPCEYCGELRSFAQDSNEARGIFRVFCNDKDCEDLSVWSDGHPKTSEVAA